MDRWSQHGQKYDPLLHKHECFFPRLEVQLETSLKDLSMVESSWVSELGRMQQTERLSQKL